MEQDIFDAENKLATLRNEQELRIRDCREAINDIEKLHYLVKHNPSPQLFKIIDDMEIK